MNETASQAETRLEFKLLTEKCPRGNFRCGHSAIDGWFKSKAQKRHDRYRARVTTAHLKGNPNPSAFYALSVHAGKVDDLSDEEKNSGWETPGFPCVHLIYLAVLQPMQRKGIGALVLMKALKDVYEISRVAGTYGMTLDAIDDSATKFYERIGFKKYGESKASQPMILPIFTIVDLIEGTSK